MKFTLSWLKKHLETSANLEEILSALTDLGLEFENVEMFQKQLELFMNSDIDWDVSLDCNSEI